MEVVEDEGTNILHFKKKTSKKAEQPPPEPEEQRQSLLEIMGEDEYFNLIIQVVCKPCKLTAQCCNVLSQNKDTKAVANIVNNTLSLVKFTDKTKLNKLKFLAVGMIARCGYLQLLEVAFNNADYNTAYQSVKFVCSQHPYNIPLWNLFNKIITQFVTHPVSSDSMLQNRQFYLSRKVHV